MLRAHVHMYMRWSSRDTLRAQASSVSLPLLLICFLGGGFFFDSLDLLEELEAFGGVGAAFFPPITRPPLLSPLVLLLLLLLLLALSRAPLLLLLPSLAASPLDSPLELDLLLDGLRAFFSSLEAFAFSLAGTTCA